jgi:uncharacterized protein (DUF885 family)
MTRFLKTFLIAIFLISGQQAFADANGEAEKLHQLFEDEWTERMKDEPLAATFSGIADYNDRLACVTEDCYLEQQAEDQAFLARLREIDRAALSEEDQLNYDLFAFELEARITVSDFATWRIPFLADFGFYSSIMSLKESVPLLTVKDYENYIARLNDVARYFDEQIANMQDGLRDSFTQPKVILGRIIPVVASQISDEPEATPYFKPFEEMPAHFSEEDKTRLKSEGLTAIANSVLPAFAKLHAFLVDEYQPATREAIGISETPEGRDYYAALVRYYTTFEITPEEVHQIGLDEVARIRAEMEAIIEKVEFKGSFAEFLEFLRTDPQFYATSAHQLLAEASYHAKRIDGKMPEFFGKLPRLSYGVRPVPDEIAPAYTTGRYWGGSYNNGRAGNYMVNTYALDKRPLYTLPSLTLHEGVPGHHHQISLTQEQEGVPEFRQNMYLSAFGEGWGLYSEKLGIEMGIYEDDYQNFGRLTYEMWRAGRLVVDTGIHAFGWSRDQAVALFVENSALSTHNINTEVDRYISWPGQALAYKMGELKILELRKKAEEALGENFDIRAFHDAVLANGSIPLTILEAKIDAFIEREMAGK